MSFYRGMTCENVTINGDKGTPITAYVAKPSGPGQPLGLRLSMTGQRDAAPLDG
jgi:hypothetical protein